MPEPSKTKQNYQRLQLVREWRPIHQISFIRVLNNICWEFLFFPVVPQPAYLIGSQAKLFVLLRLFRKPCFNEELAWTNRDLEKLTLHGDSNRFKQHCASLMSLYPSAPIDTISDYQRLPNIFIIASTSFKTHFNFPQYCSSLTFNTASSLSIPRHAVPSL